MESFGNILAISSLYVQIIMVENKLCWERTYFLEVCQPQIFKTSVKRDVALVIQCKVLRQHLQTAELIPFANFNNYTCIYGTF